MAKIFITLTGTKHYFGNDFLEKGMKIRLEKEPDNECLQKCRQGEDGTLSLPSYI